MSEQFLPTSLRTCLAVAPLELLYEADVAFGCRERAAPREPSGGCEVNETQSQMVTRAGCSQAGGEVCSVCESGASEPPGAEGRKTQLPGQQEERHVETALQGEDVYG